MVVVHFYSKGVFWYYLFQSMNTIPRGLILQVVKLIEYGYYWESCATSSINQQHYNSSLAPEKNYLRAAFSKSAQTPKKNKIKEKNSIWWLTKYWNYRHLNVFFVAGIIVVQPHWVSLDTCKCQAHIHILPAIYLALPVFLFNARKQLQYLGIWITANKEE